MLLLIDYDEMKKDELVESDKLVFFHIVIIYEEKHSEITWHTKGRPV